MATKIIAKPWDPQVLLDELRKMIEEIPDNYFNQNRWTLCTALSYLEEHFGHKMLQSPFGNDMFAMVWKAFKNQYPGRDCTCFWEPEIRYAEDGSEVYGLTDYNEETGEYTVFVNPTALNVSDAVEILAHELAHVAAGIDKGHGPEWEAAYDAIFEEYNRIGVEMFGKPEEVESNNGEA